MPVKLQPDLINKVRELYTSSDLTVKAIAEECDCSLNTVQSVIRRYIEHRRQTLTPTKVTPELKEQVISLFSFSNSLAKIASELGICRETAKNIVYQAGFDTTVNAIHNQIIQHNPFLPIDEECMYWLGLLAADGYISDKRKIRLSLKESDGVLVEAFKSFLLNRTGAEVKIGVTSDKRYSDSHMHSLEFTHQETGNFLIDTIGITPRKSFSLDIKIPLSFSFLRGYYDGNGSLRKESNNSFSWKVYSASEAFTLKLQSFLLTNDLPSYCYRGSNIFCISIGKRHLIERLSSLMYTPNSVYLERKRPYYLE